MQIRKNNLMKLGDGRVVRVMSVRDTWGGFANIPGKPLSVSTVLRWPNVRRSRFLVTYRDTQGHIGSVYLGIRPARKVGMIPGLVLSLSGRAPRRVRR